MCHVFQLGLIALEKVGLGVQLDMLILQQGGGRFKLIRQTLKFIPLPFGKGAGGCVAVQKHLAHSGDDGDDILGVAIRVNAIAQEIDALQGHIEHAGADHFACLAVLLQAQAQICILDLALGEIVQRGQIFLRLLIIGLGDGL